jgi:hypothetical protein
VLTTTKCGLAGGGGGLGDGDGLVAGCDDKVGTDVEATADAGVGVAGDTDGRPNFPETINPAAKAAATSMTIHPAMATTFQFIAGEV